MTRVQTVLGIVDAEGNVRNQRTFELEIQALDESAFHDAYLALTKLREEANWADAEPEG